MAAMIKRRTKMVSIRLLDSEYQKLKELCAVTGARSVSDLARDAMFNMLERPAAGALAEDLAERVSRIDESVAKLGEKVVEIEGRLALAARGGR